MSAGSTAANDGHELRPAPDRAPQARSSVSVVIPAKNEARTITRCLEGVVASLPADGEVIVVDGASSDATRQLVLTFAERDPRVRLVHNPTGITPRGLNAGIRASVGTVVVRMDAHSRPPANYIPRLLALLQATGAWNVGGIQVREGEGVMGRAVAAATSSPIGIGDSALLTDQSGRVETVYLGCWPRWVFDRVGLFDEELERNQDDEHNDRILEAGGLIYCDPTVRIAYQARSTLRALFRQYRQFGTWKVRVFQKHPRALRMRHVVPAAWVAFLNVGLVSAVASPAARVVLVSGVGAYGLIIGREARRLSKADTPTSAIFAALATIHAAYGLGLWWGLIRFRFRRRRGSD